MQRSMTDVRLVASESGCGAGEMREHDKPSE